MKQMGMNGRRWRSAHRLAANLALREFIDAESGKRTRFDGNLLKTAVAYVKTYPHEDFNAWLSRLTDLGDNVFNSGGKTHAYRQALQDACTQLQPQPASAEWLPVLAWAARLYSYYERNRDAAQQRVSDVPKPTRVTPPRPVPTIPAEKEAPLPEVREEVSDVTKRFMAHLQAQAEKEETQTGVTRQKKTKKKKKRKKKR